MKLITVKEYAKQEGLSEQGARKRVASKLVQSVQLEDNLLYVVVDDVSGVAIEKLKNRVKLLSAQVKTLKAESIAVMKQEEEIEYLRERVKSLETKLDDSTMKKEELYEKVLATLMLPPKA